MRNPRKTGNARKTHKIVSTPPATGSIKSAIKPGVESGSSHAQRPLAVVVRHYGTGLYRAIVSPEAGTSVTIGAYREEAEAIARIALFHRLLLEGLISRPEDLMHLDRGSKSCGELPSDSSHHTIHSGNPPESTIPAAIAA